MFEEWECSIGEVKLAPGDTLVAFTDGVTEAMSDAGEEFGDARLVEILGANRHLPVSSLLRAITTAVLQFSSGEREDDVTLVIARCR